jgi:hypothetical protein
MTDYPCQTCGECCASYRVFFCRGEAVDASGESFRHNSPKPSRKQA